MGGESPEPANTPTGAVFLSYASQDADVAKRICDALRAAGLEVWFDQSELRGGDAWDQSIRKQIKTCALFIPVISQNTHARAEGYFRLEWKLAVDRSHLISADKAFLLPVVIDETPDDDERAPERFREVQWTRLPGGGAPPAFVERVQRLLSGNASTTIRANAVLGASPKIAAWSPGGSRHALPAAATVVILGVVGYLTIERPWISKPAASSPTPTSPAPAAFAPPPHSVAVLPFVNMSGDKEQDYLSEGLTEELLNSLSRINQLQVAARTSSFSFQGEHPDIATVAHKLNVAAVLEGSVRRSANTVRVTAQLVNGTTGFHVWSDTYDRDLGDVLKLETEIATAVASALELTLLGDVTAKIEVGGTRNPAALDAYLRGAKAYAAHNANDYQSAIAAYTEAIRLDPNYASAFAARAMARYGYAFVLPGVDYRARLGEMEPDAHQALALSPELAEGHLALALFFEYYSLDLTRANEEFERAVALAPGSARILRLYGQYAVFMGRSTSGIAAARRAVVLDPLNGENYLALGWALFWGRQYDEAIKVLQYNISLGPSSSDAYALRGLSYYALGDFEAARESCETRVDTAEHEDPYPRDVVAVGSPGLADDEA